MSQIRTSKQFTKWLKLTAYVLLIMANFSCGKKPETIRAVKKDEIINMNPAVSNQSEVQQSSSKYVIKALSRPTATTNGFTIDSEVATPDNQILPLTTTHDTQGSLSTGVYQDTARGLSVEVQAQCSGEGCYKYLLILSVKKNNTTLFQSVAVSYKNDRAFYSLSIAPGQQNFFQNLMELESYSQAHNFTARDDCTENDCPTPQ